MAKAPRAKPARKAYKDLPAYGEQQVVQEFTLTQEVIDNICNGLQIGIGLDGACGIYGYNYRTVNFWVSEGKKGNPNNLCTALVLAMRKTVSLLEATLISEARNTHIKGRAAEYKDVIDYEETDPNGVKRTFYKQVKIKDELKPNPDVLKWLTSRRFKTSWGDSLNVNVTQSILDDAQMPNELDVTPKSEQEKHNTMKHLAAQVMNIELDNE